VDKNVRTLSWKVDKCKPLSRGRTPAAGVAGRRGKAVRLEPMKTSSIVPGPKL
jgi:hypothetical protein